MERSAAVVDGRTRRGRGSPRRLLAVGLVLLAALAVLAVLFRDQAPASLGLERSEEPFTYAQGTGQMFRAAGNGLAVVSSSSAELMDRNGKTVFRRALSYQTPAVYASGTGALFCEIGGTGCFTVDLDGTEREIQPAGAIRSANRNLDGWVVLCTEEPGYKARVTVYNPEGTAKFAWWSGSGYVLRAAVRPDGQVLAVLCGGNGGGVLHLFRLDSEEELASASFRGELPFDLCFLGNDRLCTVSSSGLNFLDMEGVLLNRYEYDGRALADYTLDASDFVCVCVGGGSSGEGSMATLDREGRLIGTLPLDQAVVSLSAAGRRLLALTAGGPRLYDRSLRLLYAGGPVLTARAALLRADGDFLLPSAYAAERVHVS